MEVQHHLPERRHVEFEVEWNRLYRRQRDKEMLAIAAICVVLVGVLWVSGMIG